MGVYVALVVGLLVAGPPQPSEAASSLRAQADSVKLVLDSVRAQADSLRMLIAALEAQLTDLHHQQLAEVASDSLRAVGVIIGEARVRREPDTLAEILGTLHKGASTQFVGASGEYLEVRWGKTYGYVHSVNVKMTDDLAGLLKLNQSHLEEARAQRSRQEQAARKAAAAKRAAEEAERAAELRRHFGEDVAARLLRGEIWIGMSAEMAIESVGRPETVNRTVTAGGVSEQWVYERLDAYLYFESGVLTGWQERRTE
jgi:hypothetical protein